VRTPTSPGGAPSSFNVGVLGRRRSGSVAPPPPWIFDGDELDGSDSTYEGTLIVNATGGGDTLDGGGA
jgi:hypothetical protein